MGQVRTSKYGVFAVSAVAMMLWTTAGEAGDSLTVASFGGAYSASQGSTYNGRPRPPQVILGAAGELVLARRRGSAAALG